jgi:hypothetical protein
LVGSLDSTRRQCTYCSCLAKPLASVTSAVRHSDGNRYKKTRSDLIVGLMVGCNYYRKMQQQKEVVGLFLDRKILFSNMSGPSDIPPRRRLFSRTPSVAAAAILLFCVLPSRVLYIIIHKLHSLIGVRIHHILLLKISFGHSVILPPDSITEVPVIASRAC